MKYKENNFKTGSEVATFGFLNNKKLKKKVIFAIHRMDQ